MKTQFKLALCVSAFVLIQACTQDTVAPEETTVQTTEIKTWNPKEGIRKFIPPAYLSNIRAEDLEFVENELKGIKPMESRGNDIFIPAGSSNALAAAIASAQSGDVIVLGRGDHTQDGTITISKCVHIRGAGANLIFKNAAINTTTFALGAGLHFKKGSETSTIRGIHFKTTDQLPGVAIFIDQVEQIRILDNEFSNWHTSIFLYNSIYSTIWRNNIHANRLWMQGVLPSAFGIVLSDGHHNLIMLNEVDGGLFGIWTGGAQGTDFHNTTKECLYGQILCKVPAGSFASSGTVVNTKTTTSHWLCNYNNSYNNIAAGYLVIDEAHHNIMEHNKSTGNGTYDIELTGDSHRFGFLTPKSAFNSVYAYPGQKVKDCGDQNRVYGGIRVDTSLDPCN